MLRLITASLLLAIPLAAQGERNDYQIQARIHEQGRLLGEPSLALRTGQPASIAVDGDHGYSLTLTLVEQPGSEVLELQTVLRTATGSISPTIGLRPGAPASVAQGGLQLELRVEPGQ